LQTATAPIAVVVARVDQYKRIVTTFGRQQSVALLREAATRLQARAPSQSMMARTALDEFALVIQPRSSDALAADVANWVGALRAPISVGEDHAYLTLSTGVASSAPDANESAEELIANASLAMASATQSGGARAIEFDATMRHQMESHLALEQDLRRGMAAREFEVHFQPIVDLTSGRCVSAEALLRWRHPQRGLLGPGDFIAIALDCGAILELGRQALRGACEGLARIRAQLQAPSFAVAINMSSPEVLSPTMPELLATELHRVGLFADAVTLEITETAILADLDQASAVLRKAKESGVRISLDDFGTAFSSLTWLHRLPIDTVKIDRGFVEGLPDNPGSMKLVRAIADLSHAFDRTVVAEGIEAGAQLQALRDIGVRYGQGFLFSGAVPAASFTNEWIDALSRVVAAG
jgi:diguanylate cyclase (GGDEF)-like protein